MAAERWEWIPGKIGLHRVVDPPEDGREIFAEELERIAKAIRERGCQGRMRRERIGGYPVHVASHWRAEWEIFAPDGSLVTITGLPR